MQDIYLGGGRPPRPRRIVRTVLVGILVLAALLTAAYIVFQRGTRATPPAGELPPGSLVVSGTQVAYGGSSLERVGELWVLRLNGAPFEMGAAAGRLLGAPAGDPAAVLDAAVAGEDRDRGFFGTLWHAIELRWKHRHLEEGLSEQNRAELAGLVAGWRKAGVLGAPSYQRLLWRQAAFDTGHEPGSPAAIGGIAASLAFVAAGGGPPGGRVVVGRTLAILGQPLPPPLVSFVHSSGKIAFARVGWPGELGVMTGVNAESIAVAVMPAVSEDVRPEAPNPPAPILAREVLERARSLEEAVAIVQRTRPLGSASFLLVDGKSGKWAVVDRTPTKVAVSRASRPPVIGDVLAAGDFAKDAENERVRRSRRVAARLERLVELAGRVTPDSTAAATVLRDRRGRGDARLPLGSAAAIDDAAQAQVVIIDVASLVLWVGEGPGAAGPLRGFDLRHELLGEAPRTAAQGTLVPDDAAELAAFAHVRLARSDVARGARALRAGRADEAAELAARATALAPELAIAHKLAGDAARARGDSGATDHYRRALELGLYDPAAEAEARAAAGEP